MTNQEICPICSSGLHKLQNNEDDVNIHCPRCGKFIISHMAQEIWERSKCLESSGRVTANASGWLRERQGVKVSRDVIESLLAIKTPTVSERADKLLQYLANSLKVVGQMFNLQTQTPVQTLSLEAVSWSVNSIEVNYILKDYLCSGMGWLNKKYAHSDEFFISPKGYQHLEDLKKKPTDSQIGFCAMWFDESVKNTWIEAIEPAIRDSGYIPKRIDSHEHNNRIDDEIIAMIRKSKFVVADFTGQRGGVYFEAGLALGLGLDVVWTCRKDELDEGKIHFDNRQYSFVTWEEENLDDFRQRLQNRIEATIGVGKGGN